MSRRTVLAALSTASAVGFTQRAVGKSDILYCVGAQSPAAVTAAKDQAASIDKVIDFGSIGTVVVGHYEASTREALRDRTDVRYVEQDRWATALDQDMPAGVDRMDADECLQEGVTGDGVDVAIIDTGIDADHADLQANLGTGKAWVTCSDSSCSESWDDDFGHGTDCAGIVGAVDNSRDVIGGACSVTLHSAKVLDQYGSGRYSDMADALAWTADQGYHVASMSLGGDSSSSMLHDACRYAYENGVLVVAAAGNGGPCTDCVLYPAAYDAVIAVTAWDAQSDDWEDYSSQGPEAELMGLANVETTEDDGGTERFAGTSAACPHVTAAGALLMATGDANTTARARLQDTAEDVGLAPERQGSGLVDAGTAVLGDTSPAVETDAATDITAGGVTLHGTLTDEYSDTVDCWLQYRKASASSWSASSVTSLETEGSYSATVGSLAPATDYEYRAICEAPDGATATGSIHTFTTNDGSPPSVDHLYALKLSHEEVILEGLGPAVVRTEWAASDQECELDHVEITVVDTTNGRTEHRQTYSGQGCSVKDAETSVYAWGIGENPLEVTVTAVDTNGLSGSRSVTLRKWVDAEGDGPLTNWTDWATDCDINLDGSVTCSF